jgi:alpha-glucosidase
LLPYLYTLAWDSTQTGFPPVRPLFWENPVDPALWDIADEFLLGEALLIAPVVSMGAQSRLITLPPGIWYSYWDDRQYIGPCQFEIEVSNDTIPIFVKGGTILPLEADSGISLHVYPYPGHSSSSHIYFDSGDGYGSWRVDTYYSNYQSKSLTITWETEGVYPFQYSMVKFVIHSVRLLNASADGYNIPIQENTISTPVFHKLMMSFE